MNDTNYWFYVYPNIYVKQVHREKMMLYNTDTGAVLHSANLVFNDWVRGSTYSRKSGCNICFGRGC